MRSVYTRTTVRMREAMIDGFQARWDLL